MSLEVPEPDSVADADFVGEPATTSLRWSPVALGTLVAVVALVLQPRIIVILLAIAGIALSTCWVRFGFEPLLTGAILCLGIATAVATRSSGEDARLVVMAVVGALCFGVHATGSWSRLLAHAHVERRAISLAARRAGLVASASVLGVAAALVADRGVSNRALAAFALLALAVGFLCVWLGSGARRGQPR